MWPVGASSSIIVSTTALAVSMDCKLKSDSRASTNNFASNLGEERPVAFLHAAIKGLLEGKGVHDEPRVRYHAVGKNMLGSDSTKVVINTY